MESLLTWLIIVLFLIFFPYIFASLCMMGAVLLAFFGMIWIGIEWCIDRFKGK